MRLTAQEDVALPISSAFRHMADLDYLERQLLRAGVRVVRHEALDGPGCDTRWSARFESGGIARDATLEIVEWEPPKNARVLGVSGGLTAELTIDLVPLSANATRVAASVEARAKGLRDKVLLKGLQVGTGRMEKKFASLVALLAREAEQRALEA